MRQFEDRRKVYNPSLPNPVLHLSSREFCQHAAGVYSANGITPVILPPDSKRYVPTPELSFSIRFLRAHGGLNMTASHNPPDDNGSKFYDERGSQLVPPEVQRNLTQMRVTQQCGGAAAPVVSGHRDVPKWSKGTVS